VLLLKSLNSLINICRIKEQCSSLGRKLRLAIIDDEAIFRNSLRDMIMSDKDLKVLIDIFEGSNGEKGLELFCRTDIDYAILDIDMGKGMDGLELGAALKKDHPGVIFAIHSNRIESDYREKAISAGAVSFIPKPMTLECFVDLLANSKNIKKLVVAIVDDSPIMSDSLKTTVQACMNNIEKQLLSIHVYDNPDGLLSDFKTISPDIVISDYNFGKKGDINGIELAMILREHKYSSLFYILSDQPVSLLKEQIGNKVRIDGIFRPDISAEDLQSVLIDGLGLHAAIVADSAKKDKLLQFAGRLFHDINKPVMQTGLMFDMIKNFLEKTETPDPQGLESMVSESRTHLTDLIEKYSTVLKDSIDSLKKEDMVFFDATVSRYTEQFAELKKFFAEELPICKLSAYSVLSLIERFRILDKENTIFAQSFFEHFRRFL
jgi:DNA-binding NarL/FixJ family response regulator